MYQVRQVDLHCFQLGFNESIIILICFDLIYNFENRFDIKTVVNILTDYG